jgi:hypothetical protein
MRASRVIVHRQCQEVFRANEALLARQTKAVAALLRDAPARVAGVTEAIEAEAVRFLNTIERFRVAAELEGANMRAMVALSFQFDDAAHARAREKANVFARFADFAGGPMLSDRLREALFRLVFNLSAHEWVIAVDVEVSGFVGRGLLGSKEDRYYIVEGMGVAFESVENSAEFGGTLNAVVPMCFRFEGHALIQLDLCWMQPGRNEISFALLGDREFRIRPVEVGDARFQSVIARISRKGVK